MNKKFPISLHFVLTLVGLVVMLYMIFLYAPEEMTMGEVQRIFYIHVANAWPALMGFIIIFIASIIYLMKRSQRADELAHATGEVGFIFCTCVLVTGPLWAKPAWGIWWTWDPRLTTATVMELIYAAYLMLRAGIEDPDRRARFCAVYVIVGFFSVPLTFMSARLFRTIHPVVIGGSDPNATGSFDMTPKMLQTFMFSLLAFSFFFADLLWHRVRLGRLSDTVEQLKLKIMA